MSPAVQYVKIRVDPKNDVKMISALLKTNRPFKAVTKTDYYITTKQCAILTRKKIPYTKLSP